MQNGGLPNPGIPAPERRAGSHGRPHDPAADDVSGPPLHMSLDGRAPLHPDRRCPDRHRDGYAGRGMPVQRGDTDLQPGHLVIKCAHHVPRVPRFHAAHSSAGKPMLWIGIKPRSYRGAAHRIFASGLPAQQCVLPWFCECCQYHRPGPREGRLAPAGCRPCPARAFESAWPSALVISAAVRTRYGRKPPEVPLSYGGNSPHLQMMVCPWRRPAARTSKPRAPGCDPGSEARGDFFSRIKVSENRGSAMRANMLRVRAW
jgi:hypothetical protein